MLSEAHRAVPAHGAARWAPLSLLSRGEPLPPGPVTTEAMTMNLPETLIRIESGAPDDDELAALTAVLLARVAAPAHDTDPGAGASTGQNVVRWRRPERMPGPRTPRSWQSATGRASGWAA